MTPVPPTRSRVCLGNHRTTPPNAPSDLTGPAGRSPFQCVVAPASVGPLPGFPVLTGALTYPAPMSASVIMRGVVTKMKGRKPFVEVPDLGVGFDFGPCESATGQLLHIGDRVLVVSVGGIPEDLVVVGILDPEDDEERMETRFDLRYYTQAQVDQKLAGKASASHGH